MSWNLEGLFVKAMYVKDITVYGKVRESRVAYGGKVKHHIVLIEPIKVFGSIRRSVMVDNEEVVAVM